MTRHRKTSLRNLGMSSEIKRRDFVNGALVVAATVASRSYARSDASAVVNTLPPPQRTGMRGSHPGAFEAAHALRDRAIEPKNIKDSGQVYDLVVVGGGLGGLSAAHFYQRYAGPDKSVLIIENHDDFGGHAKRNEFDVDGHKLVLNGGTLELEAPERYNRWALDLLRDLKVDLDTYRRENSSNAGLYEKLGLKEAIFFDREAWHQDTLVVQSATGGSHWRYLSSQSLRNVQMTPSARADLLRLIADDQPDYLTGHTISEKKQILATTSYKDYLLQIAKVDPSIVSIFQMAGSGVFCVGADALPALFASTMGYPGFSGLKLGPVPQDLLADLPGGQHGRQIDSEDTVHFPDGNATVARMLVASLIPGITAGKSLDDMGTASFDYTALDRAGQSVRLRLGTLAVNVEHDGDPEFAQLVSVITAPAGDARPESYTRVRGRQVIMACWNMFIPYLIPSLPAPQKEALAYGVKGPIAYVNVAIRNWQSFQKLGVSDISCPGMFFETVQLAEAASLGGLHAPTDPHQPIVVRMIKTFGAPGLSKRDQHRAGRAKLLGLSFADFEREIREQLHRVLGPGGFDPAHDIAAITVNRWPHGYAYTYNSLYDPLDWVFTETDKRPCVVARQPFGRIAIANSDAAASPHTDAAIQEAHRAVTELLDRDMYPFVHARPGPSAT